LLGITTEPIRRVTTIYGLAQEPTVVPLQSHPGRN
jgi:hypothetical protein